MFRALCSSSRTCPPSEATIANPMAARCHRSWYSTSATEARTRSRRRSFMERTTCRLSLSDCAAGRCNSKRTMPTTMRWSPRRRSERARQLLDLERLEPVAFLELAVAIQRDAALEALLDLLHVVLEALERRDTSGPQRLVAAHQPDLLRARDLAGRHHAAGHDHALREPEHLADLGAAEHDLLQLGLEHALERELHVLLGLVDDVVEPDLDLLALRQLARAHVGPHVEADDDRVRGRGEQHVGLGDLAHGRADDAHRDLARRQLLQRLAQRLDRAVHVALDEHLELVRAALAEAVVERRERDRLGRAELVLAVQGGALARHLARL